MERAAAMGPRGGGSRSTHVLLALGNVLREAQARGIELSASFLHFDRRRQGLVGVDDFMAALVELRLASLWDEHDAEDCIDEISSHRSRVYFSREDFIVYFSKKPMRNDENWPTNDGHARSGKSQKLKTKRVESNVHRESGAAFSLSNNDETSPVDKSSSKATRPLGSLLPHWAHARSKRALRELEQLSKKKARPLPRDSALATASSHGVPPLELRQGEEMPAVEEEPTAESARSTASTTTADEADADATDVLQFPVEPSWKLYDLDQDTTLSYVILTRPVAVESPRQLPKMPGAATATEPTMAPYRFTVFLDAFQRIPTLEAFFEPLLIHFPRGKILVCGFPTKMRRQTILNNEYLAAAYAKLLVHVMETTREWLVQPKWGFAAMPQFVLSFGSGTQVALQLLTTEIPLQAGLYPCLHKFALAQRGLVLINAIASSGDPHTRAAWNAWRRLLSSKSVSSAEWHAMLLRTLFSDFYLTQVAKSREAVTEGFFRSRIGFLQSKGLDLLRSLVRGVMKNRESVSNVAGNLAAICEPPFGVVVVQGSVAELSPPSQVEFLAAAFPSQAESVSESLSPEQTTICLHTAWLKSGHELLQERSGFVYELLRKLITTPANKEQEGRQVEKPRGIISKALTPDSSCAVAAPPSSDLPGNAETHTHIETNRDDAVDDATASPFLPEATITAIGAHVRQQLAEKGLKWIQQELYDRDLEGSGTTEAILQCYEDVLLAEARSERERIRKQSEKEQKRQAFEAEKRARQQEELERVVREKETEASIKRKEYEAQRLFFAQMEMQKHLQAKWLEDHRLMELEDALSLKFNDQMLLEENIQTRNEQMERKVAALEHDREEKEQERYQVALQQQRLELQHKKREDLMKFQKEFEQNQFVCSAVEAYRLDLSPDFAQFVPLVEGTTCLAQDLSHFYELKASQMDDSAVKRQQLQMLKQVTADKEQSVRNMERVILKAKSTGMIAKAGMGTVRVVPITAAEFQALGRELDEKRDELARLVHDQNLTVQQLAWQDTMLQRLSVLIKRNESFRTEMLSKLAVCADKGNEMVLCVREDLEALQEKRDANEKTLQRIRIRCRDVSEEKARAESATTQHFDTRLRIAGTTQRVVRAVLIRELGAEKEELEARISAFALEEADIRQRMKERKHTLGEYASVVFTVEKAISQLEAAVPPPKKSPMAAESGCEENNANAEYSVLDGSAIGDRVRLKPHAERSAEEKQWIALDFELNFAYYYKHLDPQQVEIIQRHPEYQTNKLKKPQLERLLALPARNCLALAFLKSAEELYAHSLLRKYTFGDGEEYFAQLDRTFDVPGPVSPAAAVVSTLEELVAALDKESNPALRMRSALLLDKQEVPPPTVSLLSSTQQQIPPHKSASHSFQLPRGTLGVLSLTVSIVFQGHFKAAGYQNGRLAAMLYALPTISSQSVISAPLPIGKCHSSVDIALCTPHSLGKVVLRHDPVKKPVSTDVTYQVVLGAPVLTTYSIEVVAHTATYPGEVLRKKRSDALKKQELLPTKKDEIQNVFTTIQLSERKKRLARKMANEAKDVGRQAELEMLRLSKLLEADNATPSLPHDERKQLHFKIHAAESKFTQQCFLFAQREEEVRDMEAALKELTKIHADLLDDVDRMERDLVEYREHLPALAAALVESADHGERDAAGARVARELNVEYTSRYGARSGKVFWAELSAVKAKLPSMMTPAERLRRKYKKGVDVLEKKEREWILLDRVLYPRKYDWEDRLVVDGNARMRLHGAHPRLAKDEEQLAVLSQMEVERIMKAPWNLLERKEIQVRKIVTRFRDDTTGTKAQSKHQKDSTPHLAAMLRTQKIADLTSEERAWRMYDQVLNPVYYPVTLKNIAEELAAASLNPVALPTPPPQITREDLIVALDTPEEELFKLPSDLLLARNLLFKYDSQLNVNLVEAARMKHVAEFAVVEKVEMDVDARCRIVYAELQRAIANTRNEFMDSSVLHTTLQRFPTKVLRLELEKELDRLLMSQIVEKEQYETHNFLKARGSAKKQSTEMRSKRDGDDSVSESDSDEEAQIAREQREQRRIKEAAKNGPRDKVRGKALKAKSIQKQRREIKDALQGRSLAEQRLLLEEQELGVGGCMACRTNPCTWMPYLQESFVSIQSRIEVLQEELERIKRTADLVVESSVCLAAVKSGNRAVVMRKADLFDEVTLELKIWDKNLRLRAVDKEFHDTFTSKEQFFETQALHGFRQTQLKDKVQRALSREHDTMVANLTAYEVVEDILESMLEGWNFGERESERKVMGYVPSLKKEGPLSMQDLRRLEQEKRVLEAQASLVQEENVQGIPLDKWKPIEVAAFEINEKNKAVKKGSALDKQLTETETALKFGIFSMTLMYFRGLSLLKKQKTVWSTSALKHARQPPITSAERKRMELEARNVAARQRKAELYDEKAQVGQARKQKLEQQRTAAYRRRMVLENQKAKREALAAIHVQRIFRGFMGRRAGRKWMLRRREIDAQRALAKAAATTLQRVFRGRLGRLKAEERRVELAEFISQIRAEEAIDEEEEYWRRHRVERLVRQVAAFVKKEA